MPDHVIAVDVIVLEPPAVIDVASVGVQGPPGATGPAGPAGPTGEPGPPGAPGTGTGDVTGPASATADALAVFSGTTGKLVRDAVGAAAFGKINALQASSHVAVGANPAQSGAVRLANAQAVTARTATNDADRALVSLDSGGTVVVGNATGATRISGGAFVHLASGDVICNGNVSLSAMILAERAAPAAPAANGAHLWIEDNGAGKTRLMVQFNTGAAIQLAIQP